MKNKLLPFLLMHFGFLFYSFYTVLGKVASKYDFLSLRWCGFYCALIFILAVYAILWQQVLKHIELSTAMANKAATIVWGMLWSVMIFNGTISVRQIIGGIVIVLGIAILAFAEKSADSEVDDAE